MAYSKKYSSGFDTKASNARILATSRREKVKAIRKQFRDRCAEIRGSSKVKGQRVDLKVLKEFRGNRQILDVDGSFGSVRGVKVGDRFECRAELVIVGVHRALQQGIGHAKLHGRPVATCVVAKVHHDNMRNPNWMIYEGEGGVKGGRGKKEADQLMRGGNSAMMNSMEVKNEVRVVKGVKDKKCGKLVYVYDGLYEVVDCTRKRGSDGYMVYKFLMKRKPKQTMIDWKINYNLV